MKQCQQSARYVILVGAAITPLMWRANRLADALAKREAQAHRLPTSVTKWVREAACLARHASTLLGVVTSAANHHLLTHTRPDGTTEVRFLRDSNAAKPGKRAERRGDVVPQASSSPKSVALVASHTWHLVEAPPSSARTHQPAEMNYVAKLQQKRQAARLHAGLLEGVDAAKHTARWLQQLQVSPAAGPSAQERMDALRARVQAREAAARRSPE